MTGTRARGPIGTRIMLAANWRSGRRALVVWVLGMVGVFAATVASMDSLYDTPAKLAAYARGVASGDSTLAINGHPYGVDTIGGVVAYEFGFMSSVAFPLMGILLVARWTRREEESGRLELIRAGAVARRSPLTSALLWTVVAFAVTAVGFVLSLVPFGVAWADATAYAASLTALGLWFAAVASLAAQLVERTRAVYGVSLGVLIVAFVLRGVGDVHGNVLTWLSPLGWAEETQPFADTRWWPIGLSLLSAAAVVAVAFGVLDRRDLGSGVLAARAGPAHASAALRTPWGLAVRMHRNLVVAWVVVAALLGGAFGSMTDAIEEVSADNNALNDVLAGGSGQSDAFLSFIVILIALVAGGFALQSAGRMAEEERDGRLEPVLAGPTGRRRWLLGQVLAIGAGSVLVTVAGGLALGAGVAVSNDDAGEIVRMIGASLAYLPAMLAIAGLATLLYAIRPSLQSTGWVAYAFVAVVAVLGETLQLPDWTMSLSPMDWVGRVPVDTAATWAPIVAALVGCGFAAAATAAIRARDIPSK